MLAITVAIRIDVYGVIYAVVLGVLFITPRFILRPIWLIYLPLHGVLLAVQYFFLLGAPPSVCYNKPGTTGNMHYKHTGIPAAFGHFSCTIIHNMHNIMYIVCDIQLLLCSMYKR